MTGQPRHPGTIATDTPIGEPRFSNAWRDSTGHGHATVSLGDVPAATIYFHDPDTARAVAAACTQAAEALDALPPQVTP